MIVKNKDQRVAVLVDVQNMYYSAKYNYNSKVNFKAVLETALAGRVLTRAIAYVIKTDVVQKEKEFFEALHKAGFEVKEKDLQIFPGGAKKGDWDIGITMDAIRLAKKVDSIVLVSGDGDYIPLVKYLQLSEGCLVEVMAFSKTCSNDLISVADDFMDMEKDKSRYLMPNRPLRRTLPRAAAPNPSVQRRSIPGRQVSRRSVVTSASRKPIRPTILPKIVTPSPTVVKTQYSEEE